MGDSEIELAGIEPNAYALELARASGVAAGLFRGSAYETPFKNAYFDVVLTAGVLIHIPTEMLNTALEEMYRLSRRYILIIEYLSPRDIEVSYRGKPGLLWKRDFLGHLLELFPHCVVKRSGYFDSEEGFDRTHWWLVSKGSASQDHCATDPAL